ncbi:outer membrane beta-barrel protein [Granulicella sp. 5B5]|uniref:outer membrane beta-barrel protein n=1 Tax=Granulicella sp. 5B5 TaxID=1617967 RepID=UPI0015F4D997|nr:outer membrane beta-barrel protein [Granulicella sp. 5B5]
MTCLLTWGGAAAHGQALVTASNASDIQVGGGFSFAASDYSNYKTANTKIKGGAFYADFDFMKHVGLELDFHQLNDAQSDLYERTYEVGGRYLLKPRGALKPYIKGLYGRGVLNFPNGYFNIAYNMIVGGGGVDYSVKPWLNVRGDFEYQNWFSGRQLQSGLTPLVVTVGVAYRFGIGSHKLKGRQWILPASRPERAPKNQQPPPPATN